MEAKWNDIYDLESKFCWSKTKSSWVGGDKPFSSAASSLDKPNPFGVTLKKSPVKTTPLLDRNAYAVTINFQVVNQPEPVVMETFLERLR